MLKKLNADYSGFAFSNNSLVEQVIKKEVDDNSYLKANHVKNSNEKYGFDRKVNIVEVTFGAGDSDSVNWYDMLAAQE